MVSEKEKQAAIELKKDGNRLFALGKFQAAAEKYTECLTMWPDWTVPLVNRATCYKKKELWDKVEIDCRKALSLNGTLTKAHFFLGLALEKQYDLPEAIKHLTKALEGARESEDQIKDEIWRELARVKYAEWEQAARHRKEDQEYLSVRLFKMMEIVHQQEINSSVDLVSTQCRQKEEKAGLERLFQLAARQDVPSEPSSTFTCNLTMEVYREPVIVPSGLSYERAALLEHLSKVGKFDPVSRQVLSQEDIRPNLALRAATQEYLDEHPWAWKECI